MPLSCSTRYSRPGLNMVTQPLTSGFLAHVNFSLLPESLLLLISFQVTFSLISHSDVPEGESTGGKGREGRVKK